MAPLSHRSAVPPSSPWDADRPPEGCWSIVTTADAANAWTLTAAYALTLLSMEHLLARATRFDPKTGTPLPQPYGKAIASMLRCATGRRPAPPQDDVMRLLDYVRGAVQAIVAAPNRKVMRHRCSLPPPKVRGLDGQSIAWLARQPGRNAREKAAAAKRVRGLSRRFSTDLHENRIFLAFLRRLLKIVTARAHYPFHIDGFSAAEVDQTGMVRDNLMLSQCLAHRQWQGVLPASLFTANNALIGDARYSKIWRARRWLHERSVVMRQAWRHGYAAMGPLLADCLVGFLGRHPDFVIVEDVASARFPSSAPDGPPSPVYGLIRHCGARRLLCNASEGISLWTIHDDTSPGCLQIEREPLTETAEPSRGMGRRATLTMSPDASHIGYHRGIPMLCRLHDEQAGMATILRTWFDPVGIAELCGWMCHTLLADIQQTGNPRFALLPRVAPVPSDSSWSFLAIDCSRPLPRVLVKTEDRVIDGRVGPAMACSVVYDGGTDPESTVWLTTAAAARVFDTSRAVRHAYVRDVERSLLTPGAESGNAESVLREILNACGRETGRPAVNGEAAVVVTDFMDEAASGALRRSLPSSWHRVWFVWRSVAAAMSWRAGLTDPDVLLAPGDTLLVIDVDDPFCRPVQLIGRRDPATEDGWFWERPIQGRIGEGWRHLDTDAVLKAEISRRLAAQTAFPDGSPEEEKTALCAVGADALLGKGLVPGDPNNPEDTVAVLPTFPQGHTEPTTLAVSPETVGRAVAPKVATELLEVIKAFLAAAGLGGRPAEADHGRVHCLLTGSLFAGPLLRERLPEELTRRWPWMTVHVHPMAQDGAARGAMVFLQRQAAGLPTWRDCIPNLSLMARDERGAKIRLDILPAAASREGLSPGQPVRYRVPQGFQIPAHRECIRLPLTSRENEVVTSTTLARISHNSFPLKDPVEVRFEVHFHYAREAFKIAVRPVSAAPFDRIDIRWVKGADETENGSLRVSSNVAPAFPEPASWTETIDPDTLRRIEHTLGNAGAAVHALCERQAISDLVDRVRRKDPQARRQVRQLLKTAIDRLKSMDEILKSNIRGNFDPDSAPSDVLDLVDRLNTLLAIGGRLPDADPPLPAKLVQRSKTDGDIRSKIVEIRVRSCMAASRLKSMAHPQLYPLLAKTIEKWGCDHRWYPQVLQSFGRVAGFSANAGRLAGGFARLVSVSATALESRRPSTLRDALWALATAAWTAHELIPGLSTDVARDTVDLVRRVFETLIADPAMKNRVHLFEEASLLLVALLRMRNTPNDGLVHAGSAEMVGLEELVEALDRSIAEENQGIAGWRIRLLRDDHPGESRPGLSPMAEELIANLLGERAAMIIALDDTGD